MEDSQELETKTHTERRNDFVWNFLTLLSLLGLIVVGGFSWFLFSYPESLVNPFPPPTLPAALVLASPTMGSRELPAPTSTIAIQLPSETPLPTRTERPMTIVPGTQLVSQKPTATPEPVSRYPFELQSQPASIAATILNPTRGDCAWMGVGGQVVGMDGRPITGIVVQLGGTLNNKTVLLTSLTGTALQYGPAGYEFTLADQPYLSSQSLWIRLVDQANLPLSDRVYFDTLNDCQKNLVIINLKQVR